MAVNSGKQRTLFQTWGASAAPRQPTLSKGQTETACRTSTKEKPPPLRRETPAPRSTLWGTVGPAGAEQVAEDDDDDLLLVAVYEAERSLNAPASDTVTAEPTWAPSLPSVLPGFDMTAADVWIYPTNYPVRDYQYSITQTALFNNTLVCLPTGLGKTFIAAVVMYNFYRWYPSGKIVFMAPTKPLVAQQIEACYQVMGIPQQHMAEMTGSTQAADRRQIWRSRRVFFLTPQVMVNDMSREACPATQVKCLVIDEAHKALGNHAYCQVVKELTNCTLQFRILALSATPGSDTKSIQQVISNLLISRIELRSEECPDIQAYSHQRCVEKIVVPLGDELKAHQAKYLQVLEAFVSRLIRLNVLSRRDFQSLTKYQLVLARDQMRRNPHPHITGLQQGIVEGDFALCISLYHGYELLLQMGLRSLFLFMQGIMDGTKGMTRARNELSRNCDFMELYETMKDMFMSTHGVSAAGVEKPFIYSHPKLKTLEDVVVEHFKSWARLRDQETSGGNESAVDTRVMIFSSFRESVQEIAEMLSCHKPLLRVMTFMGQSSSGKSVKGFTQKEQLEVVKRFREGGFNTLVSTCVGEEGLDIGEVDLIVCFDAQKSPIRLVQRMGRTGRKRKGRIVIILSEGREERTYNQSQSTRKSIYKTILGSNKAFHMYPNSPRMVPDGVSPVCHKMYITVGQYQHSEKARRSSKARKSGTDLLDSFMFPRMPEEESSNGLLTAKEYEAWKSMFCLEEELLPKLKQKESPCSENTSKVRELSLSEWRYWQSQLFPVEKVDHSKRCKNFVDIMRLIDSMREEEEQQIGECRYALELMPHLHSEDVIRKNSSTGDRRNLNKKAKAKSNLDQCNVNGLFKSGVVQKDLLLHTRNSTKRTMLRCNSAPSYSKTCKDTMPGPVDHRGSHSWALLDSKSADDLEVVHSVSTSKIKFNTSNNAGAPTQSLDAMEHFVEDKRLSPKSDFTFSSVGLHEEAILDLSNMFYLQNEKTFVKADIAEDLQDNVKSILTSVKDFLAKSPPHTLKIESKPEVEEEAWSPQQMHYPPVNFCLVENSDSNHEDEESVVELDTGPKRQQEVVSLSDHSEKSEMLSCQSWDEVFDVESICEDDLDNGRQIKQKRAAIGTEHSLTGASLMEQNDSRDLFEDDDLFPEAATSCLSGRSIREPNQHNLVKPDLKEKHIEYHEDTDFEELEQNKSAEDAEVFDCSNELFSVNFDLGFSIESSDEEASEKLQDIEREALNPATSYSSPEKLGSPGNGDVALKHGHLFDISTPTADFYDKSSTPLSHHAPTKSVSNSVIKQVSKMSPLFVKKQQQLELAQPSSPSYLSSAVETPNHRNRESFFKRKREASEGFRERGTPGSIKRAFLLEEHSEKTRSSASRTPNRKLVLPNILSSSDSEEEIVLRRQGRRAMANKLASPKSESDQDSPVRPNRKRSCPLNNSSIIELSDDDFQDTSLVIGKRDNRLDTSNGEKIKSLKRLKPQKKSEKLSQQGSARYFLEEEAEVSSEEAENISSDEDGSSEEEHENSLAGFVVDHTQLSQGLNDSEMQGVYLKSVRSPIIQNKYKMVFKQKHSINIFSQIPEQDETYLQDSFVVHEEEEEEEEEEEINTEEVTAVELEHEESLVGTRKQYHTRRQAQLKQLTRKPKGKKKGSRIIMQEDSSDEEGSCAGNLQSRGDQAFAFKTPKPVTALQSPKSTSTGQDQARVRMNLRASLADTVDFQPGPSPDLVRTSPVKHKLVAPGVAQEPKAESCELNRMSNPPSIPSTSDVKPGPLCILVNSREILSGPEIVSCLRQQHGMRVAVCSLGVCDFIVSNRMAVERQSESDISSVQNRAKLIERIKELRACFERICVIVEKDRLKPGETVKECSKSKTYTSTVSAMIKAGIRVLFSSSPLETAGLLADLAHLEQRKSMAISVPLEVTGPRQLAFNFYLAIPGVSYIAALNLCHRCGSVWKVVNSSVEELAAVMGLGRRRAEQIFRYFHHVFDPQMLPDTTAAGGKKSSR
ncbi:Fanconi anemia group M protein isoform X2 [Polypterus senegalus]|uniref:Fanconi anemia group M protein isoform X2 n=1 Tax=Polypterus senegalus TaxID=55291 RepID=UPI001965965E|nr:Fanconi anemia group M protein isoform X2 [Polypterus senegalus]